MDDEFDIKQYREAWKAVEEFEREETIKRSKVYDAGLLSVRLPTPEDLIIMKAIAHRPKDMIDSHPDLDIQRIKKWVRSFEEILEVQNLWVDIEEMLK